MANNNAVDVSILTEKVMGRFSPVRISEDVSSNLATSLQEFPYIVDHNGICMIQSKKVQNKYSHWIVPISSYIRVKKKMIYIDDSRVDIIIEYFKGNVVEEQLFEREVILSKNGIKLLLKYGISFNEGHSDSLIEYLIKSDRAAEIEYVHTHLGWSNISGIPVFKAYQSICQNNTLTYLSKYVGDLDIKPCGSTEAWLNLIMKDVLPYTPLTFCMLLGFSAPILSLLYEKYDLGTLIFSLSNESSRGKTTSAELAASVFSSPILGRGTVQSFCCTLNYLMTFLTTASGLPVVLDEGASFSGDFQQLFYTVSSGKEKGRLTKESVMKHASRWNNVVITTQEFIPIDDDTPNGIRTRCYCITDNLTISAQQADRIKTTISQNYGTVGPKFIEWILNCSGLNIEEDYKECKEFLHDSLKDYGLKEGPFTSRAFSRLAIILQTADYVSQCFDLDINMDDLVQYIIGLERSIHAETDMVQKAIDSILSEICCTSSHYLSKNNGIYENIYGKIEEHGHSRVLIILRPEFKRICKKFNLQPMIILNKFKERGILEYESDRLSKRVKLGPDALEMPCYVIKIPRLPVKKKNLIPVRK